MDNTPYAVLANGKADSPTGVSTMRTAGRNLLQSDYLAYLPSYHFVADCAGCGQINLLNARIKKLEALLLLKSTPTSPELTLGEGAVIVYTASQVYVILPSSVMRGPDSHS
jgi:hypothetical protein